MARLSVVCIVKNEADRIAHCLKSVEWADELIVFDAGSQDRTRDIAAQHGANVFVSDDWPGFGPQRQRAQAEATGDWILMIDADEQVTPELASEIQRVLAEDDRSKAYALPRLSWVFGRFIRHGGWYPQHVVRLYPRDKGRYNDALVHENVILDSEIELARLRYDLLHFTYRDLNHYLLKSAHYAKAWADQRQQQGKAASLQQGCLHGIACFLKMYFLRLGFMDGRQGFLLALLSAHSAFVKYADLWIRKQKQRPPE